MACDYPFGQLDIGWPVPKGDLISQSAYRVHVTIRIISRQSALTNAAYGRKPEKPRFRSR